MKAALRTEYGPPEVFRIETIATPVPKDRELLIRVHASPVTYGDIAARNIKAMTPRTFNMPSPLLPVMRLAFGYTRPRNKILGSEFAGEVEATGARVTRFKPGDQVFGYCGMRFGANAEYLCMPESGIVALKPSVMSYEEASTIPYGAIMALSLLRKARIEQRRRVLVNGASGGIGSFAVQFAKYFGADVTGVCGGPRISMVKKLGADAVFDYYREDFAASGEQYDLIFDVLGRSSFARCTQSLAPGGVCFLASFKTRRLLQMLWTFLRGDRKVICAFAEEKTENLTFTRELIEAGKIITVIDKTFPLERIVEAHRYAESGNRTGFVVLTL